MFSSKFYYVLAGIDIALAFVCAMIHDPRTFVFLGLSALTLWVGDKVYAQEKETKNG